MFSNRTWVESYFSKLKASPINNTTLNWICEAAVYQVLCQITRSNVIQMNCNIVIAVCATLFMPETNSVHQFVFHNMRINTSVAKRNHLTSTLSTYITTASVYQERKYKFDLWFKNVIYGYTRYWLLKKWWWNVHQSPIEGEIECKFSLEMLWLRQELLPSHFGLKV